MSKALRLTPDQARDLQARIQARRSIADMLQFPATREKRHQKYHNEHVQVGEIRFDSKAEARRWEYLVTLQRAGEITELQLQTPFELIPAQVAPSGKKHRPTVYLADFTYRDKAGALVVEDVKGAVTPEFRLKRKLMLWRHGIEVQEIRS